MKKGLLGLVALGLVLVGAGAFYAAWRASQPPASMEPFAAQPTSYPRPQNADEPWLTHYTLLDQHGEEFRSEDLQGQVHVVSFFFSTCPSVCRLQNQKVAELAREFGPQGVRFVSITCDPETDTPGVLREYARSFQAEELPWAFVTGEMKYLRRVGAEVYQVPVDKQTHSEKLIAIDKWGQIRSTNHWNKPEQMAALREELGALLTETSAPPPQEPERRLPPGYEDLEEEEQDADPAAAPGAGGEPAEPPPPAGGA